jgi:hypothetical protein
MRHGRWSVTDRGWKRAFDEPIALPDGGELRTLEDAGRYVDALPRSMHQREEWQAVMEVLLSAVEGREPVRLVHIALTLALQESKRWGERDACSSRNDGSFDSYRLERAWSTFPSLKGAQPMKFVEPSHFTDPDAAARKLLEIANATEPAQDGRIYIELVNAAFLKAGGTAEQFRAGIQRAVDKGWMMRHESGT